MRRRKKFSSLAISALMVLSLVSIIALQAAPVSASPEATYYVKTPGFGSMSGDSWENAMGTIENAITYASANDNIIVGDGTYAENLTVDKANLTIRSENGAALTIVQTENENKHVFEVTASGVSIIGFTVENATGTVGTGIYLSTGGNCVIENNTCRNNTYGFNILLSSNNTLSNNTFGNNSSGIRLWNSDYNTLDNNTIENNNNNGIVLERSDNNTLSNNTCENNSTGIYLWDWSDNNTLENNTCGNNSAYGIRLTSDNYNTLSNNTCKNNSSNGIYLDISSNYNTLENNTCENNSTAGIYLYSSSNFNTIENNICGNNSEGIYLESSSDRNTISNNTCENNSRGIILISSSDNNTLENNTCENNSSQGIYLTGSDYNTLSNNTCENNSIGINLSGSDNNTLSNNTCENNPEGIYLSSSDYNTLSNNTCDNNSSRGIYLYTSNNNTLSNNTSKNNAQGIHLITSSNYNTLENNTCENNSSYGIYLGTSSNNTLSNNTCENNSSTGIYLYTSNNNTLSNNTCENNITGIYLDSSENNTLSNNTCENNENGIYITGATSSVIIVLNNITNNPASGSGIHIEAGVDSTRSLVYYNNIVGNSPYGVYNGGIGKLNARYNWWGDASGPGGVGPGTGDNVVENVDYVLWLTEPFEDITINWNLQGVSAPSDNVEVENIAEVTADFTEDGRVSITVMDEISGAPIPGGLLQAGMFVDISTNPDNIAENIWITLHYTDGDVAGIDEGSLKLYYWSSVDNAWHLCDNITVDVNNNTVTGWVSHLTPFGMFGVPPTPAVPPALTAPANGAFTNDSTPTFDWEPVSGAASYTLQYATNSGFTQNLTTGSSTTTDYTPTAALADGTWYWRVRTVDAYGNVGDWSSAWSFTIDTATPTVTISPSLEATPTATGWTLTTTNSSIEISGSVRDATSVTVKINDKVATVVDDSFRKTVDLMVLGTNTFTLTVTDAAGNTTTRTLNVIRAGVEPPPVAEPAISSEQAMFIAALVTLVIVLMVLVKMALVKKY